MYFVSYAFEERQFDVVEQISQHMNRMNHFVYQMRYSRLADDTTYLEELKVPHY